MRRLLHPRSGTQTLAELGLSAQEIIGDLMQVVIQSRGESVARCTHFLDNRVLEFGRLITILLECRFGGIHGLGFQ